MSRPSDYRKEEAIKLQMAAVAFINNGGVIQQIPEGIGVGWLQTTTQKQAMQKKKGRGVGITIPSKKGKRT